MDLMNRLFWNYLYSFVIVFIDDIFVYLKNEVDHMSHIIVVLQVLNEHQLFSKYNKCKYWFKSMVFHCHIISSDGIEIDLKKAKEVKKLS